MQKQLIKDVNKQTSIVELVQEFVQLKKSGKNYMGLCPFHEEKALLFRFLLKKILLYVCLAKRAATQSFFTKVLKIFLLMRRLISWQLA